MNARKVIEMGEGTLLVSLPKDWTRRSGIRKGATLAVEELGGRKLMIRPIEDTQDAPRTFTVEYTGDDLGQLANDVTGAYLLGFDVIRVAGATVIPREDRAVLKSTIARLVGLEIMDEDSKRITVQFLLEPSAIVPERIVRRMSGLMDGMLRDSAEALRKGDAKLLGLVGERDDEIDRLYFLLVRATRTAIVRPEVAEGYGLSPVDVLDYRVLATFLESEGDSITELSRKLHTAIGSKRSARMLADLLSKLAEMNSLAAQAFLSRREGRPRAFIAKVNLAAGELAAAVADVASLPETSVAGLSDVIGSIQGVSKLLVDISDLAVVAQAGS